jgi:hypothetical protein
MIKPILRMIVLALLPLAFSFIMSKWPDFPLTGETFIALIIFLLEKVGLLGAGLYVYHSYKRIRATFGLQYK